MVHGRDAVGRVIRPDDITDPVHKKQVAKIVAIDKRNNAFGVVNAGEEMAVVDWRSKHVPHVWKVYENQEETVDDELIHRFVQMNEFADKDEALSFAKSFAEEMK